MQQCLKHSTRVSIKSTRQCCNARPVAARSCSRRAPTNVLAVPRGSIGVPHFAAPNFGTSLVASPVVARASAAPTDAEPIKKDERVPVTVITGFLGSGKTTLLNHILTSNHGRRIAVIENEFGEIDIDSELVAKQEVLEGSQDTIMQLSNGCLCCTVRDDLIKALNRLYDRRSEFDHIIIETTGLANPAPIISSFYMDQSLPDKVRLDGVVTVVDAKHVTRHLDKRTPKEGEHPEEAVSEAVEQIAYADRILLNKTDLVAPGELSPLEARIREINQLATIQRTQRSKVDVDYVLGVGGFELSNVESELDRTLKRTGHLHTHTHSHSHDHDHDCAGADCKHESHAHSHSHDHDHDCSGADCKHESHAHAHAHSHSHDDHDCSGPDCGHESHAHAHSHEHKHEHAQDCSDPNCTHESHSHAPAKVLHDDKVSSVSLLLEGDMDLDKINYSLGLLLETQSEDIYRMKGLLSIHGSNFRYVYQGVHSIFEGVPDREWRADEKRQCKMVFIGRELDREAFTDAFNHCLVKPDAQKQAAPEPAGVA